MTHGRYFFLIFAAMSPTFGAERGEQVEFSSPTPLLSSQGELAAWGWAKRGIMAYNRDAIPAERRGRIKEWEHYTVMSPNFTVGVTIAQLGSLSFGSVELINYQKKSQQSSMFFNPLAKDGAILPPDPNGDTDFRAKENFISFKVNGNQRRISFRVQKTQASPAFEGSFELNQHPSGESIALARPFKEPGHFFYENKIFGMSATGSVKVDDAEYRLPENESFAIFDWGRGIWPGRSQWFWGQAAGRVGGRSVAINLGHGYGDDEKGTANAMLIDGKLHKLRDVNCNFDPKDRMKPWTFTSDDGRLSLKFEPFYHQEVKQNIVIAAAELHKIHGRYSGKLIADGRTIEVRGLLGFAEHMNQRW